ncbi:hypothetical protein CR205_02930 [Alteribacter lacisalsi]|jgi:glycosyltransferase involved in cell wall biosynthesis|uniref:Glycosyltransferase family 1 protein n=1 Tax=Alteribacter lacisalsi TaxID=2045244 RepID=A0A2W0H9V3_9BACI|nr:glycosyltransferase family 4 protein [Alteribacter lacisalsi]PYZ97566.1 hypothetical protein CR205_02930 [Alteribacter lacisalsi]
MRVCHGIIEIAGQMGILSGEMKRRGHLAAGFNTFHSYLGYKEHLINTNGYDLRSTAPHIMNFFDVFHFHYASSLLPDYADLPVISAKGKKMFMHHWGNDVRFHEKARENNPFVYTGDSPSNEVMDTRLTKISRYVEEAIVQDYEVLPYVEPYYETVHVVPIAIDIGKFQPHYPLPDKKRPLILHAPTNPKFKGTEFIEAAIENLRNTHDFDYRRIEKMSHAQVIDLYREADLIVDQVLCGSHGLLSVESMALGKPVIAFIRPDLVARFPKDLPIINANPDDVEEKIRMVLDSPGLREKKGRLGRAYAKRVHAKEAVTDQLIRLYKS